MDVVYIATPNHAHFELTQMCLQAQKNVLCEKPMCLTLAQTQTLVKEAKLQNRFLMEAIWTRFMPSTKKLLNLLREKRIGKLISLEADFGFQAKFDPESRLFNPELGGGALLDIGIYPVFLSLLCLGKPHKIKALARKSSTGVDSFCSMIFDYSTNEKALLQSTFEYESPTEAKNYWYKREYKTT